MNNTADEQHTIALAQQIKIMAAKAIDDLMKPIQPDWPVTYQIVVLEAVACIATLAAQQLREVKP